MDHILLQPHLFVGSIAFYHLKKKPENLETTPLNFKRSFSERSGLGDDIYLPPSVLSKLPRLSFVLSKLPRLSMKEARLEAEPAMFGAMDELFEKTGVKPKDVNIILVNCSLFNPTPLSAMIVNHYKMRDNIKSFHLGGMGCSAGMIGMGCNAGMISISLEKDLLQANPNSHAVVMSMENITLSWYFGNDRSMLLCTLATLNWI